MQNVVPSRALSRRSRRWLIGAGVLALLGILGLGVALFLFGVPLVVPSNPTFPTYDLVRRALVGVGGVFLGVAGGITLRALTWKTDNALAESTGNAFATLLDNRYVFIRNVSQRQLGYIDAVLVGVSGVLVCRITDRVGSFYNEGEHWMRRVDNGKWRTMRWSPTRECLTDMRKLEAFLSTKGIETPHVFGVVIFMQPYPQTTISTQAPFLPVVQIDTAPNEMPLKERLNAYFSSTERHDLATVKRIAELLYHG